VSNIPLK